MAIKWRRHSYGSGATAEFGRWRMTAVYSLTAGKKFRAEVDGQYMTESFESIDAAKAAAIKMAKEMVAAAARDLEDA